MRTNQRIYKFSQSSLEAGMDRDIECLLDFRHFDGCNSYLVKFRGAAKIEWMDEDSIVGFDEQMFQLRRDKGDFAKRRVFGDRTKGLRGGVRLRRLDKEESLPESDSSTSDDSGEDTMVLPTQLKESLTSSGDMAKRDELQQVGLLSSSSDTRETLTRLAKSVHPISLDEISHVFPNIDSDKKTNLLFEKLLKNVTDSSIRSIIQISWALAITSPIGTAGRTEALQLLCILVNDISDPIISRQFTDFVSETTEKVAEITDVSFSCLSRLCDLIIEFRLKGVEPSIDHNSDETMLVDSVLVQSPSNITSTRVTPSFSYTERGQEELDDEGIISLVYQIYKMKNSEKLGDVPGIIDKYKTQLPNLFSTLMKKYAVVYADLGDPRVFIPIDEKKRILKTKLVDIFLIYEPSKLVDIDAICAYWIDKPTAETAKYLATLESRYMAVYNPSGSTGDRKKFQNFFYPPSVKEFKKLIQEALAIGNPDMLGSIDSLLSKYRGNEHHLYLGICDKYGLVVNDSGFKTAQALSLTEQEEVKRIKMKDVLERIYKVHNPSKISEIDNLVSKYNLGELFELIVQKYEIDFCDKIEFLMEIGHGGESVNVVDQIEGNGLLVAAIQAIAVCVELEKYSGQGLILTGTPSNFLVPLFNPLLNKHVVVGGEISVEMIVRGKLLPGVNEDMLRDQIEAKLDSIARKLSMRDCVKHITAGEPDYVNWSTAFRVTEHGRSHCVVSMKDSPGIPSLLSSLAELFDQQADTTANIPPVAGIEVGAGSFRAHTVITAPGNVTIFVGDFRAMLPQTDTNNSPNLYRCRFGLWASVDPEKIRKIVKLSLSWPKWLTQCSLVVDEHARTVAVVGSLRHRVSFKQACRVVSLMLSEEPYILLTIPKKLCKDGNPTAILPPQIHEWSDASFHESGDDIGQIFTESEENNEDEKMTTTTHQRNDDSSEIYRPLRLTRRKMRDSYLQGQLCLNCDATTHKPTECTLKRKVCWNCHGAHAGSACMFPCRFCKGKHAWGILECVKKGAKRFAEWLRSRSNVEEKGLSGMVAEVITKLESNDWNVNDPSIAGTCKNLQTLGIDFDLVNRGDEFDQLEYADGRPSSATAGGPAVAQGVTISPPSDSAPPLPDSRFKWTERLFFDDILGHQLMGRDAMRLIMSQKGSQIKQIEGKENCKILFRGAIARDIFASESNGPGIEPQVDIRFHAIILCDSPIQALNIRKTLIDLVKQVEAGVDDGSIPNPQIVEAFRYMEQVDMGSAGDSMFQYDYLNAVHEMDMGEKFDYVGDLRHWLHQKGIEVELGDDAAVKLPGTSTICKAIDPKIDSVDTTHVEVFNRFKLLLDNWTATSPAKIDQYWFEPFELEPVGMLALTSHEERGGMNNQFESGQVVGLSQYSIDKFLNLLVLSNLVENVDTQIIRQVLVRVRGVVRVCAKDVRLLMYLKHPWALSTSSGSVSRDVPEDFTSIATHLKSKLNSSELRSCGRVGVLQGDILNMSSELIKESIAEIDANDLVPGNPLIERLNKVPECELPYVGYIVDWVVPEEIEEFLEIRAFGQQQEEHDFHEPISPHIEPIESPKMVEAQLVDEPMDTVDTGEDLQVHSVAELKEMLKLKGLPLTGRKTDLIERLVADRKQTTVTVVEPISVDVSPRSFAPKTLSKLFKCRIELPKALMKWSELVHNLTGPNNSHFGHITQQCPSATVVCLGSVSAALVGDARLHVKLTATNSNDFNQAKSLIEDLVRAVVEVGIDVSLADEPESVRIAASKEIRIVDLA